MGKAKDYYWDDINSQDQDEEVFMGIEMTQFIAPNGERKTFLVERPEDIEAKAGEIIDAGYKFECEVLTTGQVSLTIADPSEGEDVDIEVTVNDSSVNESLDRMINRFHKGMVGKLNQEKQHDLG